MLELQHSSMRGLHISDAPIAVDGLKNDFLALAGEVGLPSPVPGSFRLPAVINDPWWMRPMWHTDLPAFGRQDRAANRACAPRSRRCLLPRSIDDRVLHDKTPTLRPARHHWRLAGVCWQSADGRRGVDAAVRSWDPLPRTFLLLGHRSWREELHTDSDHDVKPVRGSHKRPLAGTSFCNCRNHQSVALHLFSRSLPLSIRSSQSSTTENGDSFSNARSAIDTRTTLRISRSKGSSNRSKRI